MANSRKKPGSPTHIKAASCTELNQLQAFELLATRSNRHGQRERLHFRTRARFASYACLEQVSSQSLRRVSFPVARKRKLTFRVLLARYSAIAAVANSVRSRAPVHLQSSKRPLGQGLVLRNCRGVRLGRVKLERSDFAVPLEIFRIFLRGESSSLRIPEDFLAGR
jgi:hypothetical protein